MESRDPIFEPFEAITGELSRLEPTQWGRLLKLLDYYVSCELKRRQIVSDSTPLPIARNVQKSKRAQLLRLISKKTG